MSNYMKNSAANLNSMSDDMQNPFSEMWESDKEIIPFDNGNGTCELPLYALPPVLADVIEGVSTAMSVYSSLAFSMCLPCVASACQHIVLIQNEAHETHLNLWVWSAAGSGERKSSTLKYFIKPIQEFENEANKKIKEMRKREAAKKRTLQIKVRNLEAVAKKEDTAESYLALEKANEEFESFEFTPHVQLMLDDSTTEASASILAENGGYGFVASSEARIFDIMSGRAYNNGVSNIDLYLKGFSNEYCRFNRKSAAPIHIEEPAVSMCLSVQPEKLKQNLTNSDFTDTGFCDRAVIISPESNFGNFKYKPAMVQPKITAEYNNLICDILKTRFDDNMRPTEKKYLRLTPEADKAFETYFYDWQNKARNDLTDLKAFGSKFFEVVQKVAAIFQVCENTTNGEWEDVSLENTQRAIILAHYLAEQTIFVRRGGMREKSDSEAQALLEKMLKRLNKVRETEPERTFLIYREDIQPHCKIAGKSNREGLNPLLQELTDRNYISPPVLYDGNQEMPHRIETVERATKYYINVKGEER